MGYELWVSKNTGIRRNGTGFIDLKKMFTDTITARFISEELMCCKITDDSVDVKHTLESLDFDSAGVIDDDKKIIGYVIKNQLNEGVIGNSINQFEFGMVISDSTPLSEIMNVFKERDYVYVNYIDRVVGIVAKADLNKPPVRVYLFGVISLFELHLSYWVGACFKNDTWQGLITEGRLQNARTIFESRQADKMNQKLTIIECLQLCDKRKILASSPIFLNLIQMSKSGFTRFMKDVENIRNNLAHSQSSIIDSIEFPSMNSVISNCENFLLRSDEAVMDSTTKVDLKTE